MKNLLRKIIFVAAAAFVVYRCVGSSDSDKAAEPYNDVKEFSYSEVINGLTQNDPNVVSKHFKNYTPSPITDAASAVENAAKECTIEHTSNGVYYDKENDVWMVDFFTMNMDGGNEMVYMKSSGETLLIVYGE